MKNILKTILLVSIINSCLLSDNLTISNGNGLTIVELKKIQDRVLLKNVPIDNNFLSIENGGVKPAIDAYSDGIGMIVVSRSLIDINNSIMNREVFASGEKAKKEGLDLKQYLVKNGKNFESENLNVSNVNSSNGEFLIKGTPCSDGDYKTINDIYIDENYTCKGNRVDRTCFEEEIGSEFLYNGVSYLVVDNSSIRDHLDRAETLCVSNVSDMSFMFYSDSSFNKDISNWDVSHVVNMASMFTFASSFNQNISSWNVSNVKNMDYMFYDTSSFNQNISSWNVSNVLNHLETFKYSSISSLNKPTFK